MDKIITLSRIKRHFTISKSTLFKLGSFFIALRKIKLPSTTLEKVSVKVLISESSTDKLYFKVFT